VDRTQFISSGCDGEVGDICVCVSTVNEMMCQEGTKYKKVNILFISIGFEVPHV
jgi:hypothetical protein